jgi:8-oxo-dGTP pyrophosphatase MutT (NUDIX family)
MFRPDLVDVWVFRVAAGGALEVLLLRRSAGRILPGLWQGVSGSLEPGERVVEGALRELREETGIDADAIEAFYDLDQVNQFHEPTVDAILSAAVFAVRVRPGAEVVLSQEHDTARWVSSAEALSLVIWPAYRESIARIVGDLLDPERARWFALGLDGSRVAG